MLSEGIYGRNLVIGIMLASDTKRLHLGMSVQELVEHDYTISNHNVMVHGA